MAIGKLFVSAMLAGIMISVGGIVNLACITRQQPVVGAFLFTAGLFTVCLYSMAMYTGRIGYVLGSSSFYKKELLIMWMGNFVGTLLSGLAVRTALPSILPTAAELVSHKLLQSPAQSVLLGVFCGVLVFIAVDNFANSTGNARFFGIILCIPAFILAGFEHTIADMFYLAVGAQPGQLGAGLLFLLLVTAGNSFGALLLPLGKAVHSG